MPTSSPKPVLISGLAAGAAFALVLEADLRLTGNNVDDFIILGRPFSANRERTRRLGVAIHAIISVALAALYGKVRRWLPGPPWLKGVIFANVENALLYPITVLEDLHPAVREGAVGRYLTWPSFWQSVPRHIAYGLVLGILFERLDPALQRCSSHPLPHMLSKLSKLSKLSTLSKDETPWSYGQPKEIWSTPPFTP